ncbi:two-component regulator propeller domain-containing protein [Nonlabens agnitus]|uniref:Uncharacterized protein n=1 Tax=Nonlabens agnitus TaxID=870484 RepID=A0A2S9WUQ7_9FLAO|nr:two-component regulator propeller domain-containing protein [Nonlabens agnitus]PRP67203.1 hypothetical protein BST86_08870 [Nonlabens agnitus]
MKWHNLLCCLLVSLVGFTQQYPSTQFSDRDILPNNTVRTLFIAKDGALWIGTDNGLVRKFNDQVDSYFKEDGLTQNNIWAINQDDYGNIWIGSYGKGLFTLRTTKFFPTLIMINYQIKRLPSYLFTMNGCT